MNSRLGAADPAAAHASATDAAASSRDRAGTAAAAAGNDPHGRSARTPAQIPAAGWKDILWRVKDAIIEDDVTTVAAGCTYYMLLSMVPMLSALISIYGLFSDPASVQSQLDTLQRFIPGGGMEILGEQLKRLSSQPSGGLTFAFIGSLLIALWTANAGMKALINAMNVAYNEKEKRSFVRLTLISLAFTVAGIVLMAAVVAAVVVLPNVLHVIGVGNPLLVRIGSLLLVFVAAVFGLSALYRWGPSRRAARWSWISPGATITLIIAAIAGGLFSWYVSRFGSYNETYGSLGALIGFMTWLWIMSIVLVIGAELNAEIEHQSVLDTTTGRPKPLGSRGAEMADTVGVGSDMTTAQARAADTGPKGTKTTDSPQSGAVSRAIEEGPDDTGAAGGRAGRDAQLGAQIEQLQQQHRDAVVSDFAGQVSDGEAFEGHAGPDGDEDDGEHGGERGDRGGDDARGDRAAGATGHAGTRALRRDGAARTRVVPDGARGPDGARAVPAGSASGSAAGSASASAWASLHALQQSWSDALHDDARRRRQVWLDDDLRTLANAARREQDGRHALAVGATFVLGVLTGRAGRR